ncbi:MAG: NAD-dependent deacylase [Bacteroidales bacterium]|nr:NAD-dependent deacylase [Bacteroidales bacterium]
MNENAVLEIASIIKNAKSMIAFTGAGISVESGIPSFRGEGGLWSKYDPGILSLSRFIDSPSVCWKSIKEIFYDYWGKSEPNSAHKALAKLEELGFLKAVVTMNIDNLHQKAGSKKVIEFHGTLDQMVCMNCGKKYSVKDVSLENLPPKCKCGGILKPDFIFFEEGIPQNAYKESFALAEKADVVLVIGTTGEVTPAAYIPTVAKQKGAKIIEINPSKSAYTDNITDIYLPEKAGIALTEILNKIYSL